MLISLLAGLFSNDLAIDLGTANTLVYVRGEGIVMNEPSSSRSTWPITRCWRWGTTPRRCSAARRATSPPSGRSRTASSPTSRSPRRCSGTSSTRCTAADPRPAAHRHRRSVGITQVEKRAVLDSAKQAGAREVYLIEEPMAAAIGAGPADPASPAAMIVDIGGGTTEVAVMSLARHRLLASRCAIAGDEMDEAIVNYIRKHYNMLIGERRAEEIKIRLGIGLPDGRGAADDGREGPRPDRRPAQDHRGDRRGDPRGARGAGDRPSSTRCGRALERTPPELAADIVDKGIVLAGGGALLRGLDQLLRQETDLPITVADDPLSCVALGTGKVLDQLDLLKKVALPA